MNPEDAIAPDPAAVGEFLSVLVESLDSTLDPDSQRALLDDIRRRAHDPRLPFELHPEALADFQAMAAGLRVLMMIRLGGELP